MFEDDVVGWSEEVTLDLSTDDFIVASLKWVSNNSGWS